MEFHAIIAVYSTVRFLGDCEKNPGYMSGGVSVCESCVYVDYANNGLFNTLTDLIQNIVQ